MLGREARCVRITTPLDRRGGSAPCSAFARPARPPASAHTADAAPGRTPSDVLPESTCPSTPTLKLMIDSIPRPTLWKRSRAVNHSTLHARLTRLARLHMWCGAVGGIGGILAQGCTHTFEQGHQPIYHCSTLPRYVYVCALHASARDLSLSSIYLRRVRERERAPIVASRPSSCRAPWEWAWCLPPRPQRVSLFWT